MISITLPARVEAVGEDKVAAHPVRTVIADDFAVFWRDAFGTVHFYASDREAWDRWFDEHPDEPAVVDHDEQGRIEE